MGHSPASGVYILPLLVAPGWKIMFIPECRLYSAKETSGLGYLRPWGLTQLPLVPASIPADRSHPQAPSAGEVLFPRWLMGDPGHHPQAPLGASPIL